MTKTTRALALAVSALAGAATIATAGPAHAACHPLLDPDFCDGILKPLPGRPERCEWRDDGTIVCYWDR